jgi:putative tricarboxylic transport membrane protein
MKVSINGTQLGGLAFLGLSIGYGYAAADITLDFWSVQAFFTARTLPYIIATAGIICASLLILMSAYGAMLEPLGFIFATSIFLIAGFQMLGIHQWWVSCRVSVALALGF